MSQARFQKQQREKARQQKAAAKRDRRASRTDGGDAPADGDTEGEVREALPQDRVLAELAALHAQFDDGAIDFDEFEERKRDLIAQLSV